MNEEEQAKETVAGWLGHRPQREVLVAIIVAPIILTARVGETVDERIARLRENINLAVDWADEIIATCKLKPTP